MTDKMKILIKQMINRCHLDDVMFLLLRPFHRDVFSMDSAEATAYLQAVSPEPQGTSIGRNHIEESPAYDLQIIVPAYNVASYVTECLESIVTQQTQYRFFVVVVDDGATDETGTLIDPYSSYDNVKIIHQANRGFSGARNTGLKDIQAEYVMFVDSDDKLAPGAIESLMNAIKAEKADIVEGGCFSFDEQTVGEHHSYASQKKVYNTHEITGFFWGKVYKSSLFENRIFPEGYWFEDTCGYFTVFSLAHTMCVIPQFVYYYRNNPKSITKTSRQKPKCIDTFWVTKRMLEDHKTAGMEETAEFFGCVLHQLVINYQRTQTMDEKIKRCLFQLSADWIASFGHPAVRPNRDALLWNVMEKRDYAGYLWYMKTHFM